MTNTRARPQRLHDARVHVRFKIAALWTAIMALYIYNDLFALYVPGAVEAILAGKMGPLPPTSQALLLMFAASMIPPSLMVFLPLLLPAGAARWVSVAVGLVYAAFVAWTLTPSDTWLFYLLLGVIEIALSLLSAWLAWTWPKAPAE